MTVTSVTPVFGPHFPEEKTTLLWQQLLHSTEGDDQAAAIQQLKAALQAELAPKVGLQPGFTENFEYRNITLAEAVQKSVSKKATSQWVQAKAWLLWSNTAAPC